MQNCPTSSFILSVVDLYFFNKFSICDFVFGKNPAKVKSSPFLGICERNVATAFAPASEVTV